MSFNILKDHEHKVDLLLDKIDKKGLNSLEPFEKNFLDKISTNDKNTIEKIKKLEFQIHQLVSYDPRQDPFFNSMGVNFTSWSDEEVEFDRYEGLWSLLSDDEILEFLNLYSYDTKYTFIDFYNLPKKVQKNFIKYFNFYKT